MIYIGIILASALALFSVAVIATALVCFFKIFFSKRQKPKEEYPIPPGRAYQAHREQMIEWIKQIRSMPYTDLSITSFDGLTLRGKYYECKKGAPIEILFHGYKGTSERDLCGGVSRCFSLGHNALMVDHRASGNSEGRVITFGAKECRDCLGWIDKVISDIDKDAKIILTGISMGAATVMMAAGKELPKNVIGVLADCGYTSTEDIVKKVMRDMKLPPRLLYPFARLGARLFGGFDPNKDSPIRAMERCHLPIIFFHGDSDRYVPCSMSERNFAACVSDKKRLVITKGAEHGLCFPTNTEEYLSEMREFFAI